jgi:polyribonucleotide nucleotidyltransferase
MPTIVGLLHISEVAPFRIKSIRDVMKLDQEIQVKVVSVDGDRIRLSRKALEEDGKGGTGGAPSGPREHGRRPYNRDRGAGGGRGGFGRGRRDRY